MSHMVKLIFKEYKKSDEIFFIIFFLVYKNVNKILSKNKERLSKKARERYQNLSEEKNKKHQYAREQYGNLS